MNKRLVTLGIASAVVLAMALLVGTALAQGPNPGGNGTCTPQDGDQLHARIQLRLKTCTPEPLGDQVQTQTRQGLMFYASQGGDQLQTRTKLRLKTCTPEPLGTQLQTRNQQQTQTQQRSMTSASVGQRVQTRTRAR